MEMFMLETLMRECINIHKELLDIKQTLNQMSDVNKTGHVSFGFSQNIIKNENSNLTQENPTP